MDETVNVEFADAPDVSVRLVGFRETVRPLTLVKVSETVPVKPPRLVAVTVEDAEGPTNVRRVDGILVRLKSAGWLTVKLMATE